MSSARGSHRPSLGLGLEGVLFWVSRDPEQRVSLVSTSADFAELGHEPATTAQVIILDLELKRGLVVDAIPALASAGRRIIAFSQHHDPDLILRVLEAGCLPLRLCSLLSCPMRLSVTSH